MDTMVMTAGGRSAADVQALRRERSHAYAGLPGRRRVARQRPHGRPTELAGTGARLSRAPHPLPRNAARAALAPARTIARRRDAAVVAVTVVAIVLIGLVGFMVRGLGDSGAPAAETTVQVEPGDTLFGIAERVAPGEPAAATIGRIRVMNELAGTTVHSGQTLRVPVSAG